MKTTTGKGSKAELKDKIQIAYKLEDFDDETLIFEMDDHLVMDYEIKTEILEDYSSTQYDKLPPLESILSSSLPIKTPALPLWRSDSRKNLNTFIAPHILSQSSNQVVSGSLPSSRRSRLNMI